MSSYMNRSGLNGLNMFPPVIKALLISNVAIFLIGFALPELVLLEDGSTLPADGHPMGIRVDKLFGALWPIGTVPFLVTQYLTHLFLHGSFGHLFFNMLALWMFGMELEQEWGSKRFLAFYLLCGLGAGITQSVITSFSDSLAPTVGASGAIMGVMVAFAMLNPDRIIYVQFFLPLKAKYAVMGFIAIDLFMGFGSDDNIAHFAHLGGALTGFIYYLYMYRGRSPLGGVFGRTRSPGFVAPPPPPAPTRARVIDVQFREAPASHRHAPQMMDFGSDQERIDAILDKITREGYQKLTDEEKRILQEASKRMR